MNYEQIDLWEMGPADYCRTIHLNNNHKNPNDEFYTRYEDVEAELSHWKHRLEGKRIICSADEISSN